MKLLVTFIIAFLLSYISLISGSYERNIVIIKLSDNQFVEELNKITGNLIKDYKISPFLSKNTLKFLKLRTNSDAFLSKYKNNYGLDRIYKITFNDKISPLTLASKLSTYKEVNYAEPLYIRALFSKYPNDSLLSEQYALFNCKVFDAVELLGIDVDSVIVGVVDTGVDYLHEDIAGKISTNKGEEGLDENGNDKKTNGVDDDGNGFVDDWHGWDFGSSDSLGYDNDPYPGGNHGTHVSGIIAAVTNNDLGVAATNPFAKILPVKIGFDNPWISSLTNSYEGLLYAGLAGADIINCSWGGGGYSQAEQDIISQVNQFGALIVAAAGNNNENIAFYPASYDGVISVAAVDDKDERAYFTNYDYSVDVSAPGVMILSTVPGNEYVEMSGTSMASPVAAAVAGLIKIKYPDYSNFMIGELLKASSDNLDSINPQYVGLIGRGRVNAFRAISDTNLFSLNIESIDIISNKKNLIISGDTVKIHFSLFNTLKPLNAVVLEATSSYKKSVNFKVDSLDAGNFETMEKKYLTNMIEFVVPETNDFDVALPIDINITSLENYTYNTRVNILVNPSYRTINKNHISLTVTSRGNLAYNDYPANSMGEGMSWKGSDNLLFESALIVGVDSVKVSDMARASDPSYNSGDFLIVKAISVSEPGLEAPLETYSEYKDLVDSTRAGAKIQNSYYQFVNPEMEDCVIGIYDIINRNENFVDSMFAGLYFDWDIGTSGAYNQIKWDFDNKIALCYNTKTDSLPNVGVMILSEHNENFYAIDNDGSSEDNPGVYDGFTKSEKWKMISSGIGRATSEIKDVSMVLAAGPISLRPDDTNRVIFGILASNSTESLIEKSKKIRAFMQSISSVYGNFLSQPKITLISKIYPNPVANGYLNIELFHQKVNYIIYNITDINGREIEKSIYRSLTNVSDLMPGIMNLTLDVRNFAQGAYLLNLKTDKGFDTVKFVISK